MSLAKNIDEKLKQIQIGTAVFKNGKYWYNTKLQIILRNAFNWYATLKSLCRTTPKSVRDGPIRTIYLIHLIVFFLVSLIGDGLLRLADILAFIFYKLCIEVILRSRFYRMTAIFILSLLMWSSNYAEISICSNQQRCVTVIQQ